MAKKRKIKVFEGKVGWFKRIFGTPEETWVEKRGKVEVYEGNYGLLDRLFKSPKYTILEEED